MYASKENRVDLRLLSRRRRLGHPQVLHARFRHLCIYCVRDQHDTDELCIPFCGIVRRDVKELILVRRSGEDNRIWRNLRAMIWANVCNSCQIELGQH